MLPRHRAAWAALACAVVMVIGCGFGGDADKPPAASAPTAEALPEVDPCTLVTAEDAKPYVPGDYFQNRFGTSGGLSARGQACTYFEYANAISDAEVSVLVSMDPFTADKMKERADKWIRKPEDTIDPVTDAGDLAYVVTAKDFGEVWVLIGNRAFVVHITDKDGNFLKDDSIKLARQAAKRFPASAAGG